MKVTCLASFEVELLLVICVSIKYTMEVVERETTQHSTLNVGWLLVVALPHANLAHQHQDEHRVIHRVAGPLDNRSGELRLQRPTGYRGLENPTSGPPLGKGLLNLLVDFQLVCLVLLIVVFDVPIVL